MTEVTQILAAIEQDDPLAPQELLPLVYAERRRLAAQLIPLRHFAGLSVEDAVEVVGTSRSTAYEHWAYVRARLRRLFAAE